MISQFISRQFWGGHPNTFRTLFAWASLSFAVSLVMEHAAFDRVHEYEMMRFVGNANHWAALFAVHWACVTLVVLFGRMEGRTATLFGLQIFGVGVGVQLFVNWFGFMTWAVYVCLQDIAISHWAINAAAERVLLIYSVWAFLRTSINRSTDHA